MKVAVLALGIGLVGVGVAALAGLLAGGVMQGRTTGFGGIVAVLLSLLIGYPAGACIGIVLAKRVFHQRGSLWLGFGGVVVGAVLTMVMAEPLRLNSDTSLLLGMYACSSALLGAGGFLWGSLHQRVR